MSKMLMELLKTDTDFCWNCNNDLGYQLTSCCSGRECGCMGWPVEWPFCSDACWKDWQYKRDNPEHTAPTFLDYYMDLPF